MWRRDAGLYTNASATESAYTNVVTAPPHKVTCTDAHHDSKAWEKDGGNRASSIGEVGSHHGLHGCRNLSLQVPHAFAPIVLIK